MASLKLGAVIRPLRPLILAATAVAALAGCEHYPYDPYFGPYDPYYGPTTYPSGVIYQVPGSYYRGPRYRRSNVNRRRGTTRRRRANRRAWQRRGSQRRGARQTQTRRTEPVHTKARTRSFRQYRDRH